MGLAKRVIPCLDVTAGRVVKGINFVGLRDGRDLIVAVVEAVAAQVFIPLTVGGGVRSVGDVRRLLNAGADKVSINTAAVETPELVREATARYGSQCIVVAVDAKRVPGGAL